MQILNRSPHKQSAIHYLKLLYLYRSFEFKCDFSRLWLLPSNNNAGVLDHAQVFHPLFSQKLLSMVTDHNHLVGVFHQQPVITGHSQMTALALCSLRFKEV